MPTPQGINFEIDRERLRWNETEEREKLLYYNSTTPNTPEMDVLFSTILGAVDRNEKLFVYIQGYRNIIS